MTSRDGPALAFHPPISELLAGAALVALVPAGADADRAAAMAWQLARAAANAGRKVALVDCHVDEPQLHAVVGEPNEEGIVDVFEYGASLSRIAQQQPEENLYFLPAGTFAPDPAALMGHQRWRRLSAGFRHEDAVMLLYLPGELIGAIAPNLDGIVALAPAGADADLVATPEIQAAVDRGVPLLATVLDTAWLHAGAVATAGEPARPAATVPSRPVEPAAGAAARPSRATSQPVFKRPSGQAVRVTHMRWGVYAPLLLLVTAAAVANYRLELGLGDLGLSKLLRAGARLLGAAAPGGAPDGPQLVPHAVDSLPFAVQVSSWTGLAPALDAADALEGDGFPPIVAPLRLGTQLWYRVYVGPVATRDAADSLRDAVRAAGFDRPLAAVPALVPLSVAVERVVSAGAARAARARLRAAGIPAFVLGRADGSYEILAGAFQTTAQASYLDSLLTSTGRAGRLGPRVGSHP
jgi:cell division septation protein DedD